jgi:CHAT domain-containing protein
VGRRAKALLHALLAWAFLTAALPAAADNFTFDGELEFQAVKDPLCAAAMSGKYHVVIVGENDSRGIEAYLYGERLLHAAIHGANPSLLSLTFIGESGPQHEMRLRQISPGAYTGQLQAISLLGALYACGFANAEIKIQRVTNNDSAALNRAAEQLRLDNAALQAAQQGLKSNPRAAINVLEQAMAAKQQLLGTSHPQLLAYYYFLAQLHMAEGSLPAAVSLDRQALEVCEKSDGPDSACAGAMLVGLGNALAANGIYGEAESTLRRALIICDKFFGPTSPLRGRALNGLSAVLIYTGRYGEAETTLAEALSLNRTWPQRDNPDVGVSLNNYGVLYQLTGQQKKSIEALRQAVAIDEKVLGAESSLTLINNVMLADALRVSGQYAEAEPIARHALTTAQKLLGPDRRDHPALATGQICLAEIYRATGRISEAEPLYREALLNETKYLGPDHPATAGVSLLLAKLLHATRRDPEALQLLSRANDVAHVSGDQMIAWQVAGELMQIYAAGQFANRVKAIYYGKQAVNDLQSLRGNLSRSSAETQQAFVSSADVSAIYRTLAALLIAEGRAAEAQQVLAMVKEQEFYEFTERKSEADAPKTVAALNSSEKQLDELNGKYVSLGKEYGELKDKFRSEGDTLSAPDRARLQVLRKAMDAAQADFEARAAAIAKSANDPEAQKRRGTEINDYSRAFQGTLNDIGHDAVVAQYIILDDRVAILLATPNVVVFRESKIPRADLYSHIRKFRQALSNPSLDPLPESQTLYKLLMAPIAGDLQQAGAKTLMLDLDGMLRYIPYAALYDGKNYLVETLAVAMVTEAARDKLAKAPKPDWSVWGLGVTKGGAGYEALPYANVELNGIAGEKGVLAGKVMLDGAFTENALRDGLDRSYPVIHIASHFQFTSGSMQDSFLLLGDGSHFSLAQIKTKLNFNSVELLTLSACETAVGDDSDSHNGVEVEGLGAIAQQAGAKAVLATLWPVADASTAALMQALYQAHKTDHLDKADALRQAQLALLKGRASVQLSSSAERGLARRVSNDASAQGLGHFVPNPAAPYAHPFFWAPFILMGNWL